MFLGFFVLIPFEMHSLYIIYSKKLNRYYTGETNDISERLRKHNDHSYKYAFTTAAADWELKLIKEIETKEQAVYLEKFIKRMKSKVFIQKVIAQPNILDELLKNFQ